MPGRASTGSRSHHSTYGIFALVGAGMFFDGYDLYVAAGVLAATSQSNFSTLPPNLQFLSLTFVGMTLGSLITGFVGDKMGRRFTYQINLLVLGLASLAAAFVQDMTQLIVCRFIQGLGLGGYSTMTEFVPPKTRGRWLAFMAFIVVAGSMIAGRDPIRAAVLLPMRFETVTIKENGTKASPASTGE